MRRSATLGPRRARRTRTGQACLAAVALIGALAGCQGAGPLAAGTGYVSGDGTVTTWAPGSRPGPVTVAGKDLGGKDVSSDAMAPNVVVINFWQSACPPCRAEAGDLAGLARELAGKKVRFLGVNSADDAATAQAFARAHPSGYPTILDTSSTATAELQGVVALKAVPTTVVLDPQGKVAGRVIGRIDPAQLRAVIGGAQEAS